jgi:UDP-4-amino-4,6-dideoxy-N-acetyl-beta-L-altrosamine N-acetyltransferase
VSATRLRQLERDDLDMLRAWRNDEGTRRHLFTRHEIGPAEHLAWFEIASADAARHLLMFELEGVPSGFVNIGPVLAGGIAAWGFYAAPGAPRGTGSQLGRAAVDYAFGTLGLYKLVGEVLAENTASLAFHERLGFQREAVLPRQHFDGERYHDVVRYGLLRPEAGA